MALRSLFRGWLAVSFVQQLGLTAQTIRDPALIHRTLFDSDSKDTLAGYIFAVLCLQQALLKAAILVNNADKCLNLVHVGAAMLQLAFFAAVSGSLTVSVDMLSQVAFAGVTVVLTGVYLIHEAAQEAESAEEKAHRPRKLTARHYLEAQIDGYGPKSKNE